MSEPPNLDSDLTFRGLQEGETVFERYTLAKIIGRGGMGIVWLARDEKLGRDVALKFLPEFFVHDRFAVDQLKRETNRCLGLTHEGIVRIYDFLEDPPRSRAAISMEYIAGSNLSDLRLERPHRCFGVEELGPVVLQVCEALHYAHQRAQIVHRDIKPANLLLGSRGEVKITDFGIAHSLADSASRVSAEFSASAGTLSYMSPQQALGERPSPADDVYALGATLYDLLTGRPPFHSGNVYAQLKEVTAPPMTVRRAEFGVPDPGLPPEWDETIRACLEKAPERRPQSAMEVAQRLGLVAGAPAPETAAPTRPAAPVRPVAPTPPRAAAPAPRSRLRMGLLAGVIGLVALVAASAVGVYLLVQRAHRGESDDFSESLSEDGTPRKKVGGVTGVLQVPAKYKTIQAAIDAAAEDATVSIAPGIYQEALRLKNGVKIVGADAKTCKLQAPNGPPAAILAIRCAAGSIEGLDISPVEARPAVYWPDFALDPQNRVRTIQPDSDAAKAGLKIGLLVRSINSQRVPPGSASYLLARQKLSLQIEDENEQTRVISLSPKLAPAYGVPSGIVLIGSPIVVRNCEVHGFPGSGIHLLGAAGVRTKVQANDCSKNGDAGILLSDGADAEVRDNTATNNRKNGIEFYNATGLAESNHCLRNEGSGLQISGAQTRADVRRNDCNANLAHGITAIAAAAGAIESNICEDNAIWGIYVADLETKPHVSANTLKNNKKGSLEVAAGAAPSISNQDRR